MGELDGGASRREYSPAAAPVVEEPRSEVVAARELLQEIY